MTSLPRLDLTKEATVAHSNRKHEHNKAEHFGKKSRLITWELKLEWEHLFRTFFNWFRRKTGLGGLQERPREKQNKTAEQAVNISSHGFRHENENTAYFWINSALEASNRPQNNSLYPYKCPDFHLRKILPQFWANKHFIDGDRHYGGLHTKLANLTKFSRGGDMTKRAERWPIIG